MIRYKFTEEDKRIIKEARKKNKDKRAEVRLLAMELRSEGKKAHVGKNERGAVLQPQR